MIPQLCESPAAIAVNVNPPDTGTGTWLGSGEAPLPSCPAPFIPQQYAAPEVAMPQV